MGTIKAKSKKELANEYAVSMHTFNKWLYPHLKSIGEYLGRRYTPKQVSIIYDILNPPEKETL